MAYTRRCGNRRREWCLAIASLLIVVSSAGAGEARREITLSSGVLFINQEDPERIYGLIPLTGLGVTLPIDARTDCFLRISYASDHGNPYYGYPTFRRADDIHMKVVPIEWGLRAQATGSAHARLLVGLSGHLIWAQEDPPPTNAVEADRNAMSGVGWGFAVLIGPEFRLRNDRLTAGAEWSLGIRGTTLSNDNHERTLDLSGMSLRGYLGVHL